jgi:putative two-component system response regulator
MSASPLPVARILIVDDNLTIISLLQYALRQEGYRVVVAQDGQEALDRVAAEPPELILLDLDLPILSGDEVCRRLKNDPATRTIPVVMLTALGELENKLAAWDYGADEFLTKPFRVVEVLTRCRSLLRIKQLGDDRDSAESVVYAFARAVEAKSPYTHGHSERVKCYALALADELGVSSQDREVLRKGALLHDVGKISIPDVILDKPDRLTFEEYEIIKGHPAQGAHILEPLRSVVDAIPLIRWHHERLDGKGYPDGIRGEQIPVLVRILSVCDIYDSLKSDRPYRPALEWEKCVAILRQEAGGGLDPELVERFVRLMLPVGKILEESARSLAQQMNGVSLR